MAASIPPSSNLAHRAWVGAREALLDATTRPGEVVALLAAPGVGKTALLIELERSLTGAGRSVAFIENGELANGDEDVSILLVDEAERTSDETLRRIAGRRDQVAVFAGLPGFAARLRGFEFLPIALTALEPEEIASYLAMRMAAMGSPPARFSADGVAALGVASGGVPRLLNLLIGSALFAAGLEGDAAVTAVHVRAAAEMHDLPAPPEPAPPAAAPEEPIALAPPSESPPAAAAAPDEPPARPPANDAARKPDPDVIPDLDDLAFAAPPPAAVAPAAAVAGRRRWPWIGIAAAFAVAVGAAEALRRAPPSPRSLAGLQQEVPVTAPPPVASNGTTDNPAAEPTSPSANAMETASLAAPSRPAEQADMPRLPLEPPARVVMVYPMGDAAASARAVRLTAGFRRAGLWAASPFPVPRTEDGDMLSYFFQADRAAAVSIAALAGHSSVVPRLAPVPAGAPMPRPGTVEWALPRGGTVQPSRPPIEAGVAAAPATLPAAVPTQPQDGVVIDAPQWPLDVTLGWSLPATSGAFVEVYALGGGGEGAAPTWREIFSGYAAEPLQQVVSLPQAAVYAWRVLSTSPGVPHYATGPWSRFTVQVAP